MNARHAPRTSRLHTSRGLPALALLLLGTLAALPVHGIDVAGAPRDGWARYEVPLVEGIEGPCCYQMHGGTTSRRGCDLDRKGGTIIRDGRDMDAAVGRDEHLVVYLHFSGGQVERVQAYGASCPVRAVTTPVPVSVQPSDSAGLLAELAHDGGKAADGALVALAHHRDEQATALMVAMLDGGGTRDLRRDSVFWLAQLRGAAGVQAVERVARSDRDDDLREHAVFSLSQAPTIDTFPIISSIASTDRSGAVRAKALFWLAQMGDPRAAGVITTALRQDPSSDVREQAVFALSQLHEGADAALVSVVRGDYPRAAKKEALFWLGQSGSDVAIELLDRVLADD